NNRLEVPDHPVIPFIAGDGCGVDVWPAARNTLNAAVQAAYHGSRRIAWLEVYAGEKSQQVYGTPLPAETLQAFSQYLVGIKGPLGTPVGGGMRSLNVALRKTLDLYACVRPVRWFRGVPAPTKHPEKVDMVIFRENTEDLYSGIEFPAGTDQNRALLGWLQERYPAEYQRLRFNEEVGIGLKPVSREGSRRLVRAAIRWALENRRRRVTLVHKGNIMKYTEGAFRQWGYELARQEFPGQVYTQLQWEETRLRQGEEAASLERERALQQGKLYLNDIITDAAFERTLTCPEEFDVLATTNLNGDYLSDALAAQVGGIGIAPGANINFESGAAIFEATHGTAPTIAGKDIANPCSLILSGSMLLAYLGWKEAAALLENALQTTLQEGIFTADLQPGTAPHPPASTSAFAKAVIQHLPD
ncbi:MAG TPA: NADP-dependent isocitrate dehydrogenase, partial [Anaerolineaceae bacterium]|nr:NADP-dependent isocitrate dehydrogenase [Anaerolineaceae bacterium]